MKNALADHCLAIIGIDRYVRRSDQPRIQEPKPSVGATPSSATINPPVSMALSAKTAKTAKTDATPQPLKQTIPRSANVARPTKSSAVSAPENINEETIGQAPNLESLQSLVAHCRRCTLCQGRKQAVAGVGSPEPQWLIVGEAPGEEEDQQGEPFVGTSGRLLSQVFAHFGIDRKINGKGYVDGSAFITNAIKCRPPGNRTPTLDEIALCQAFLRRQIALLDPRIIVAVGRTAAVALLQDDKSPLGKLRERLFYYETTKRKIPLVVTYHPAYLLRNLPEKRKSWEDVVFALQALASHSLK